MLNKTASGSCLKAAFLFSIEIDNYFFIGAQRAAGGWSIPLRRDPVRSREARSPRGQAIWDLSCTFVFVPDAGDFSTTASPSLEMTLCTFGFL